MRERALSGHAEQDDILLIEQARNGDREAFDRLITRHEEDVLKTALYLTRNVDDAKDIAQEVYIKIFRNLEKFRTPGNFQRWIYRITVNTARDFQRRRRLWVPLSNVLKIVKSPDPVGRAEVRTRLMSSMARLSFSERATFIFKELHGLETADVAEILGCSPGTVRGYLHTARKKLQQSLSEFRSAL